MKGLAAELLEHELRRHVVERLLAEGDTVWTVSRTTPDGPAGVAGHLNLDTTADDATAALKDFLPELLHGVVYAPGSITLKPLHGLTVEQFRSDYDVNVLGAVRVLQAALPALRKSGRASVVLFSTVATAAGMSFHASIAAAKAAVEGLGISLAAEWARLGIRVNVVAPSLTDTPLAGSLLANDAKREASARRHPVARIGDPGEIAGTVVHLLGDDAAWITGQVIRVDGGLSSLRPL